MTKVGISDGVGVGTGVEQLLDSVEVSSLALLVGGEFSKLPGSGDPGLFLAAVGDALAFVSSSQLPVGMSQKLTDRSKPLVRRKSTVTLKVKGSLLASLQLANGIIKTDPVGPSNTTFGLLMSRVVEGENPALALSQLDGETEVRRTAG